VAIQSDGKIVVSGEKCNSASICDLAVARYNTDGTLDTTFSGDGRHVVGFGSGDNAGGGGLAIRADGKIWIAGYMTNSSGDLDFAIYRLNSNGSLDTTFSGDGKLNGAFGVGKDDFARDLLIQPGGKVVIVGTTCAPGGDCDVALARMTAGGALDATFSGDGKQITNLGGDDDATGVARKSDGKIVVSGVRRIGDNASLIVARYNTDGTLDATFSGDGKQVVSIGPNSGAMDVRVQADGKIVMAGAAHDASYYDAVLVRLNTNGSLDTTFSGDGKLRVDFGGNEDMAAALVRQSDGKYVLAGATWDGTQLDFALARVLP
jgi:uncharacterized delta-60 repeat protein